MASFSKLIRVKGFIPRRLVRGMLIFVERILDEILC